VGSRSCFENRGKLERDRRITLMVAIMVNTVDTWHSNLSWLSSTYYLYFCTDIVQTLTKHTQNTVVGPNKVLAPPPWLFETAMYIFISFKEFPVVTYHQQYYRSPTAGSLCSAGVLPGDLVPLCLLQHCRGCRVGLLCIFPHNVPHVLIVCSISLPITVFPLYY
jgi:hypothetical protein